jgi:DUF971 family protein
MTDELRELRLNAVEGRLELEWTDGRRDAISYPRLRERCMCAQCRKLRHAGAHIEADAVTISDVVPCGPNAVQLIFSDGHDRGIFPFPYLRTLVQEADVTN